MRLAIAVLLMLVTATVVHAQSRDGFTGPLTGYEAGLMSDVWSDIREVEDFDKSTGPRTASTGHRPAPRRSASSRRIGTSCGARNASGTSSGMNISTIVPDARAAPSAR